jgi:hypothetical protein
MVRRLILALAVAAGACGARHEPAEDGRLRAHIAEDVELMLPSPPGYPETRTLSQIVRARYGERSAAFEAVLDLSPEQVTVVITALGGPRVATLTWNEAGVREERTLLAPTGVPVENILADIFLVVWPTEAVAASLPEGVELVTDEDGRHRRLQRDGETIVEIAPDPENPSRAVVRNLAFEYEVTITSLGLE